MFASSCASSVFLLLFLGDEFAERGYARALAALSRGLSHSFDECTRANPAPNPPAAPFQHAAPSLWPFTRCQHNFCCATLPSPLFAAWLSDLTSYAIFRSSNWWPALALARCPALPLPSSLSLSLFHSFSLFLSPSPTNAEVANDSKHLAPARLDLNQLMTACGLTTVHPPPSPAVAIHNPLTVPASELCPLKIVALLSQIIMTR